MPSFASDDRSPRHPRHLLGSKWTRVEAADGERHWEVVEHHRKRGVVVLHALLTNRRVELPWKSLRDRVNWSPGWS